jgi:hypothetical protein
MLLSLPVQIREVWHWQHGWSCPWRTAEQGNFQPVLVPILPKRPRYSGSFGSLQILVYGSEPNRATAGDRSQPQTH